jgi:hypothetical protein
VTCTSDQEGLVGVFAISPSRRNDAAFLFRHNLQACRTTSIPYLTSGYVNRLRNAADFRRLICDAFAQENEVRPVGRQVRPGIWVGAGARIEREARVVAPAFIGAGAKVCRSAVVTRGSNIERGAFLDCGTVVEDASILPSCYVGAGLDLTHAVVGFRRIAHLDRKIEIEVHDRRLLASAPKAAAWRVAGMTAAAMEFVTNGFRKAPVAAPAEPEPLPEIVLEDEPAETISDRELRHVAAEQQPTISR